MDEKHKKFSQEIIPKKNRSGKTTTLQYEELVKYMETHSGFAASKFLTKEGKIGHNQQWNRLQELLNALSKGPGKTVKQWQTVWRDLKSNASKKASKLRNERNKTGISGRTRKWKRKCSTNSTCDNVNCEFY